MTALITEPQRAQLLANGAAKAAGVSRDPVPVVKLFTPDAHATWLLVELDPEDGDTAFGLCDVGIGMPELAHVRVSALEGIRGPKGERVQRDLHFQPRFTLAQYAEHARDDGSIND